jgi:hypothetical protein
MSETPLLTGRRRSSVAVGILASQPMGARGIAPNGYMGGAHYLRELFQENAHLEELGVNEVSVRIKYAVSKGLPNKTES